MKKFVFILASLFFVNANAQMQATCDITKDPACKKQMEMEEGRVACKDAISSYNAVKKTVLEADEENKKESEDKIEELRKDLSDKADKAREDMTQAEQDEQAATIAYTKAKKDLQDQLDIIDDETTKFGREKSKELQEQLTKLEAAVTTETTQINATFISILQEGYRKCKLDAEAIFADRVKIIRENNAKANSQLVFSGGASLGKGNNLKKAKKEAKDFHTQCVKLTDQKLSTERSAALETIGRKIQTLKQDIQTLQEEITQETDVKYKKKLASLNAALQSAEMELNSAKDKAEKEKQRIAAKLSADELNINNQIKLLTARANGGHSLTGSSRQDRKKAREDAKVTAEREEACNVCSYEEPAGTTNYHTPGKSLCSRRSSSGSNGTGTGP